MWKKNQGSVKKKSAVKSLFLWNRICHDLWCCGAKQILGTTTATWASLGVAGMADFKHRDGRTILPIQQLIFAGVPVRYMFPYSYLWRTLSFRRGMKTRVCGEADYPLGGVKDGHG